MSHRLSTLNMATCIPRVPDAYFQATIKADPSCNDSLFSMHMIHSDLSFHSMTQHVQHLPSSMHLIVTQHFTALLRKHACGEVSQCERLGELGADPSSPPGLQPSK